MYMKLPLVCKYLPAFILAAGSFHAFAAGPETGLSNFFKVNETLYRGAQPSDQGWGVLAKLGVKTVIDLRMPDEHSTAAEEKAVTALGMKYVNIPMQGVVTPSEASISKALMLMNSTSDGPVFVHCKRGADRTGTVIAVYRIAHDHWDNGRAMHEAKSHGMRWTQIGLKRYIANYRPAVVATTETAPVTPVAQ